MFWSSPPSLKYNIIELLVYIVLKNSWVSTRYNILHQEIKPRVFTWFNTNFTALIALYTLTSDLINFYTKDI